MSLYDYEKSKEISKEDPPFAALIMSAIRKADTTNAMKLKYIFSDIYDELQMRYDSPGGLLPEEIKERRIKK
jgi:hypothetical protein